MTVSDRPLLLTADPRLLEELRGLAVAAGVEPDVASDPAAARRSWASASVVVVGSDLVDETAGAGLGRRAGVLVAFPAADTEPPWPAALALGAERVVSLPAAAGVLVARLEEGRAATRARATVLGVVGGAGGVGASVLATALALAARRAGSEVLLVDLDPGSGGLDLALGAEEEPGVRWPDLAGVAGLLAPESLRGALPSAHGVDVLSVDRAGADAVPVAAVPAVVDSAANAYDVLVLDLPRGRPEVLDVAVPRCDRVLLVTTPDVRGAAASLRPAAGLRGAADVRLVVRHRRRAGAELDTDELAAWLDLEVAAEVAYDAAVDDALDRGDPPGAATRSRLARTCDHLVAGLVAR